MEHLRQSMLTEAEMLNSKRRFGLFSQSTTLALGDNTLYPAKTARKGEDGKPVSKPRNMLAGPNKSGVTKKDFLNHPDHQNYGKGEDKYLDPEKVDYLYEQKFHGKTSLHEHTSKPNSHTKTLVGSVYKHIDEDPVQRKMPAKDESGRVITKDRNLPSNPGSKISKDLYKQPKHIKDPYDRKDLMASQEKKLNQSKMMDGVFRSMSHGNIAFGNDRKSYGVDQEGEMLLQKKKLFVEAVPRVFAHQTTFKLARRGHGDTIGKYPPQTLPESKSEIVKTLRRGKSEKEDWKHVGNKSLGRPTPSISYSSFNLRRHC